jgi:hypothetical protein
MKIFAFFLVIIFLFSCKNARIKSHEETIQNTSNNSVEIINDEELVNHDSIYNIDNSNIDQEFTELNDSKIINDSVGIESKLLKISDEYKIKENLLALFMNYHPSSNQRLRNNIIFPWDISQYPNKIYATDHDCHYIRPPYSNNTIPCAGAGFYIYNIKNGLFTENNADIYYNLFVDHDRGVTRYYISSPEWTLASINDSMLCLINKNHEEYFSYDELGWHEKNNRIIEYLLTDFKNTIFDNGYIMETIRQICNNTPYYEIITKYGMVLLHWTYSNNGGDEELSKSNDESNSFFYLLNRLNKYFNVNINFYNEYNIRRASGGYPTIFNAQIYDNGFFFYSPSRIVFFDLKKHQVVEYKFDKNLLELSPANNIWIHVSQDNTKFYISLYTNHDRATNIYEYDF